MESGNIICTGINGDEVFYMGINPNGDAGFSPLRSRAKFFTRYDDALYVLNMLAIRGINCHIEMFRKVSADDVMIIDGYSKYVCDKDCIIN